MEFKNYLDLIKNADYLQLHRYYTQTTIFDTLGVARQENPHSSFIKWLLEPDASHQLGYAPMKRFIQTLCLAREKLYIDDNNNDLWTGKEPKNFAKLEKNDPEVFHALRYGKYDIKNFTIEREHIIEKQRRADIFITFDIVIDTTGDIPFKLLIENKINSDENDNQTVAYAAGAFGQNQDSVVCCVYLTTYKTSEIKSAVLNKNHKRSKKILPASNEFLSLNYQYLLDGVIEPMESVCTEPTAKEWLSEYIRVLGQAIKDNDNEDPLEYVMAISQKEKRYAQALWAEPEFRGVILSIIESLGPQSRSFPLDKTEKSFWTALGYCYSVMIPEMLKNAGESEKKELKKLEKKVGSIGSSSSIRRFSYKRNDGTINIYRSHSSKSIGLLCRDMLEDVIVGNKLNKQQVKDLRTELQKLKNTMLCEVILFDEEIPSFSVPKYFSYTNDDYCDFLIKEGKYTAGELTTCSIEEFSYVFFSAADILRKNNDLYSFDVKDNDPYHLEIKLDDGTKCYIAKFWGSNDVERLRKLLHENYGFNNELEEI